VERGRESSMFLLSNLPHLKINTRIYAYGGRFKYGYGTNLMSDKPVTLGSNGYSRFQEVFVHR
jgi:hypothetical protein